MEKIHIIIEVVDGINQTIFCFKLNCKAIQQWEELVVQKGFRKRLKSETFDEYQEAYNLWTDTEDCTFDPYDWYLEFHDLTLS